MILADSLEKAQLIVPSTTGEVVTARTEEVATALGEEVSVLLVGFRVEVETRAVEVGLTVLPIAVRTAQHRHIIKIMAAITLTKIFCVLLRESKRVVMLSIAISKAVHDAGLDHSPLLAHP